MRKLHCVRLAASEHDELVAVLRKGCAPARVLDRARVLLLAHDGHTDAEIVEHVRVGATTVQRLRRRFAAAGLEATLHDRPRTGGPARLDAHQRALMVALNGAAPPAGHRWTLQRLADALVELGVVKTISSKTVGRVLKRAADDANTYEA